MADLPMAGAGVSTRVQSGVWAGGDATRGGRRGRDCTAAWDRWVDSPDCGHCHARADGILERNARGYAVCVACIGQVARVCTGRHYFDGIGNWADDERVWLEMVDAISGIAGSGECETFGDVSGVGGRRYSASFVLLHQAVSRAEGSFYWGSGASDGGAVQHDISGWCYRETAAHLWAARVGGLFFGAGRAASAWTIT